MAWMIKIENLQHDLHCNKLFVVHGHYSQIASGFTSFSWKYVVVPILLFYHIEEIELKWEEIAPKPFVDKKKLFTM